MKKTLLLLIFFAATGKLMAQNNLTTPTFDNTLKGALTQPFKTDTTWRNSLLSPQMLYQPKNNIDLNRMLADKKFDRMLAFSSAPHGMPNVVLDGRSNMPVKKLEGNSKMPVLKISGGSKAPVVESERGGAVKP